MPARPSLLLFTEETPAKKVRLVEDVWNSEKVAMAYITGNGCRNRTTFVNHREEAQAFLNQKWAKENDCRLIKELLLCTQKIGSLFAMSMACMIRKVLLNVFRLLGFEVSKLRTRGGRKSA